MYPSIGNLDDTIDVDGLSLNDLKNSTMNRVSPEMYRRTEELEVKRRALFKELQQTKTSLELIFKTENLNDLTGKDLYGCVS